MESIGLLDIEHRVLPHDRDAHADTPDRPDLPSLSLSGFPGLVFRPISRALIREKQHLGSAFPFANLSAGRCDLSIGAPSVIAEALTDAPAHQVKRVPAGVPLAGREVLRGAAAPPASTAFARAQGPRLIWSMISSETCRAYSLDRSKNFAMTIRSGRPFAPR